MRPLPLLRWIGFACAMLSASAQAFDASSAWSASRQMVVVTTDGWNADHGVLRTYVRDGASWKEEGKAANVTLGKNGSAWGIGLSPAQKEGPQKHEGDNRSPAGVFRIGETFGYASSHATAMPYVGLKASDYCVDVDGSPYYNKLIDTDKLGADAAKGSSEPMRRDLHLDGDGLYRLGFVIEHNPEGKRGGGSCIFAHLWRSPTSTTAGCTAMTDGTMERLLAWLDPRKKPVFVLLPEAEYVRLRTFWRLPKLL